MDWLKIVKIKIMVLVLAPLCFGIHDDTDVYSNLIVAVKEAKFTKFKHLYSKSTISAEQKKELLNLTIEIIETERKYWRSYKPVDNEALIGKKSKTDIKACSALAGISGIIAAISLGFVLRKYFKEKDQFLPDYQNLQNGATYIPSYSSAALESQWIDWRKSSWFSNVMFHALIPCCPLLYSVFFFAGTKMNQKILNSYKRWKKALKIKQLIQQPITNAPVTAENSEPVKVGV